MADIVYNNQGMFTSFTPVTDAGVKLWTEFVNGNEGHCKVLSIHAKSVIAQMRKAGFSVSKAKKVEEIDAEALLAELGL